MDIPRFKPFTDNVIFMDTEFSTNDPYEGEILSIALVKLDGEELYLELEFEGEANEWVKKHILPKLDQVKSLKKGCSGNDKKICGR